MVAARLKIYKHSLELLLQNDKIHLKLIKTHPVNYSCHVSSAIRQIKARPRSKHTCKELASRTKKSRRVLRRTNAASTFYLYWYLLENVTGKRQREAKGQRNERDGEERGPLLSLCAKEKPVLRQS